jgi:hypothetical protein
MLTGCALRRSREREKKGGGEAGNPQKESGNLRPATARTASATMEHRDPGLR